MHTRTSALATEEPIQKSAPAQQPRLCLIVNGKDPLLTKKEQEACNRATD